MQISAIRNALAAAASTVTMPAGTPALNCTGYTPDGIVAPCLFVNDITIEYDKTMGRGTDSLELTLQVLVSRSDDAAAQATLDGLLDGSGPGSLKAAIEAARGAPGEDALGGLADDLRVERVQGYRWFTHSGVEYLGAELIVRVIGAG